MNFINKYKLIVIMVILEGIFYFRLNLGNYDTFFLSWAFIGIALFILNSFNAIKAHPFLSLFNENLKENQKKSNLFNERNITFFVFFIINIILYFIA